MKYVALIPARGGSKRIPRKNLALVGGVTLVERAIRVALGTDGGKLCSAVYVSTEDVEIADVARKAGATVVARPFALAADDTPMEAVVAHFIESVPVDDEDVIILLEPTAPLRTFWHLLQVVGVMGDMSCARIVSGEKDGCHGFRYIDTGLASALRVGPFRNTTKLWPDQACLFPPGTRLLDVGLEEAIDVDYPEDLEHARQAIGMEPRKYGLIHV